MVDVAISTEDRPRRPSSVERTADTGIQTDAHPPNYLEHPSASVTHPDRLLRPESSRTVGTTQLLKDTVIRGKGEGPKEMGGAGEGGRGRTRTLSSGEQEVVMHSPKTEALMALSQPRKPIRRSQSHVTVSGETLEHTRIHTHMMSSDLTMVADFSCWGMSNTAFWRVMNKIFLKDVSSFCYVNDAPFCDIYE